MSMTWRSWSIAVLSVTAGLMALVLLSTLQFEATLTRFVQGRLAVLAQSIELSFHSATMLGLSLSSVRNASAILERARQTDPKIVAIHVYDQDGRIVHSTRPDPPSALDADAIDVYRTAEGLAWEMETAGELMSGKVILNLLRTQSLGGIVVVYPKTEIANATLAMAARLLLIAAAVALVAAACSLPLLVFALGRLERPVLAIEHALTALERETWRSGAGGPAGKAQPDETEEGQLLVRAARAADDRYRAAGLELAELEAAAAGSSRRVPG